MKNNTKIILGLDISLRATGYCVIRRKRDEYISINPLDQGTIETKPPTKESDKRRMIMKELSNVNYIQDSIDYLIKKHSPDVIVMETPYFSQSAKGAYALGVCHMIIGWIIERCSSDIKIILPKQLKDWAGTKRGEKKEAVKRKVRSFGVFSKIKNDNILDAIGICFMQCDEISRNEYENERKEKTKD